MDTERMMTVEQAAAYCKVPDDFLTMLMHKRRGPAFIEVSTRIRMYRRHDLDRWMQSWVRHDPFDHGNLPESQPVASRSTPGTNSHPARAQSRRSPADDNGQSAAVSRA